MVKNYLNMALMTCVMLLVMCSCGKSFKIKGNIGGVGNQNLHMVYATPAGIAEQWVTAKEDRFEFSGVAEQPTLVAIYGAQDNLLARFLVENGDNVKVRGAATAPFRIEVKGNDVNERWYAFIHEHEAQYANSDRTALNTAIEQYAKANPADVLSTLLLLCDYRAPGGIADVEPLLKAVKPEAKPDYLLSTYRNVLKLANQPPKSISSMMLYESIGSFATFSPTSAQASLLYFWNKQTELQNDVQLLKTEAERTAGKAQFVDVLMDADSMMWSRTRKEHMGAWRLHFWAPDGPLNSALKQLNISAVPSVLVADSLGKVTYAGSNVKLAVDALKKLVP